MEGSASQAGFYYQNNIAALRIIECLFFKTDITEIRLENYDKGHHIDDIIIYRNTKIEYYQIKWSEDSENSYTLYNLLTAQAPKKSIFRQLAEGYLSVNRRDIDFSITLFTKKRESSQKRPKEGLNHSLEEIRKNFFEPLKKANCQYDLLPDYDKYKVTLDIIRKECCLNEEAFNDFIKKLKFEFSQEPTEQIQNAVKFKLKKLGIEITLFEKLLDGIVNWSITGESINKNRVLKHLGIEDRFEDKLSHHFKVEDNFYVPNNDLLSKISIAITELKGGFILIEGLPGIGKSTALTKFKESSFEITLAYYCFIPDAKNEFGELRHKSNTFLKSLCIAIENQFPDVDLPNKYSERFEEKFISYIDKLGTINGKIIFIIDGLDHVHRGSTPYENSLLNQINGSLPDGIFFILSSQYKTVLTPSVILEIESDKRRHIVVSKFTQREIEKYLENKGIDAIDLLDQIEKVSSGIPLYLHYISELLLSEEKRNYVEILNNLPTLIDGKINLYHKYLFQKIESDEFAKWVLVVFAHRKEYSTADTICEILKLAGENKTILDVITVINNFSHLLRQTDGRAYSIFHNSFREFIISETASLKEKFNEALVLFYEQTPFSDESYRNYFKHLNEVGEYKKIISTTTLEWIKSAWQNYRTIEEIESNLKIALNACVEILSLSEFVRIVFLKSQFAQLTWNIENSEIDFPILLLNSDEISNSLRSIWDGDFVLRDKEYFSHYLIKYYSKTGNILPSKIAKQGFSKNFVKGNDKQLLTVLKAKTVAFGAVKEVFDEIESMEWVKSENNQSDYFIERLNDEDSYNTNLKIKSKIIAFLYECKKYDELLKLSKEFETDKIIFTEIQIALVKLLISSEKSTAFSILSKIDFSIISDKIYFQFIAYCSDYLTNEEFVQQFPQRTIKIPILHNNVINHEGVDFVIHKDILELFSYLKSIWVFKPEMLNKLLLKIPSLPIPSKSIYSSIFYLSELWNKNRTLKLNDDAKLGLAKQALDELYNYGLFDSDYDNDGYFIAINIKYLFKNIFNFSVRIFSRTQLEELINYWLTLENESDRYSHYTVPISIVEEINSAQIDNLKELTLKLINYAEDIVRLDEQTVSLTTNLGQIAEIYGICGFKEDFKRIYNQLIEIAFGLAHKKDYQASYIISPLELLHKTDSNNTLKRLEEVYKIQKRLGDAGKGRMFHICLSDLISFTALRFPELGFTLLVKEEKNIFREEAINRMLKPLIESSTKENLRLLFSVVKTIPRWEQSGARDNFFHTISIQLLERGIEIKENTFITELLEVVIQNAIVELEDLKELEKYSEIFIKVGEDYTQYLLPIPKNNREVFGNEKRLPQDEKFGEPYFVTDLKVLIKLFENDYLKFESLIQSQYEICLRNRRIQTFRNEYYRSKSIFEKFYDTLSNDDKLNTQKRLKSVIRNYINLKNQVVNFNPQSILKTAEFEVFLNDFVIAINNTFPDNTFRNFVDNNFEKNKWIDNILQFINDHRDYVFSKVISEETVFSIVEQVSILHYENLITFINKSWTSAKTKSISFLKIANRLVSINPTKSKEILSLIVEDETDNLLFSRKYNSSKSEYDIIETLIRSDKGFGKKFILRSYFSQKNRYSDDLVTGLDSLLKYEQYFDNSKVLEVFYEANLQYNKELAEGLPEKSLNYDFILYHKEKLTFAEIVIKYLVDMFNYPVVKIRELTLQAIFDLVNDNLEYLKILFKLGIENGTDNQIEHCLVVFHAISIKNVKILFQFKDDLFTLTHKGHFNILESLKELLLRMNAFDKLFLTESEINQVSKLNTASPIIFKNKAFYRKKGKKFVYSSFQAGLLKLIYFNENDDTEIQDDVFLDLVNKKLGDYNADKENAIHRAYNINSNFDVIEIVSPYTDEVQSSINRILHSKVKNQCFEKEFLNKIKAKFRIYDPSQLLYKVKLKPNYINWLSKDISAKDFVRFKDFDILIENFVNREPDYLTLAEFGSQRTNVDFADNQFVSYFEVFAYLKKRQTNYSLNTNDEVVLIKDDNIYMYEVLPSDFKSNISSNYITKPIIDIYKTNFREQSVVTYINLSPEISTYLRMEQVNLLEIIKGNENYPIEASRWQTAYTTGSGRRRYKPSSEGFTFKIKKNLLKKYLVDNDMVLCYDVSLRRSTTKNKSENGMEWYDFKRQMEICLE